MPIHVTVSYDPYPTSTFAVGESETFSDLADMVGIHFAEFGFDTSDVIEFYRPSDEPVAFRPESTLESHSIKDGERLNMIAMGSNV